VLKISEENKKVIVGEYGKNSSRELSWAELSEICTNLEKLQNGKLDKARKRVIAVIGAYLRQTGQKESIDIIKGIACRATSYAKFNDIPIERLRNIYYCFKNKNEDKKNIGSLIGENLTNLSNLN
jgi:orotate phosphoribosyltransferase-like protein